MGGREGQDVRSEREQKKDLIKAGVKKRLGCDTLKGKVSRRNYVFGCL